MHNNVVIVGGGGGIRGLNVSGKIQYILFN